MKNNGKMRLFTLKQTEEERMKQQVCDLGKNDK